MNHHDLLLKLMRLDYDLLGKCDMNDVLGASEWVKFTNEEVAELSRLKNEAFTDWIVKNHAPETV